MSEFAIFEVSASRLRFGPSTYVAGRPVAPTPIATDEIAISPEPASSKTLRDAGVGDRQGLMVITESEIRTAREGEYLADRVVYGGRTYEAHTVDVLEAFADSPLHYEALLVELQPQRTTGAT